MYRKLSNKQRTFLILQNKETVYGQNWNESRQIVFKHYGQVCQDCGSTIDIDVHHKIPLKKFHGNTVLANHPANLIPLCKKCHRKRERALR